jgi:hypothetical protein
LAGLDAQWRLWVLVANLESRSFNVEFDGDGRSGIYTCRDGGYSSIPG